MGLSNLKIQLYEKIEELKGKTILDTFSWKLKGDDYIILLTEERELIMICSDFDSYYEECELGMANRQTLINHIVENENLKLFLKNHGIIK